jgi:hypothetical protein
LELAKRLKKLGVKQQSALYWVVPTDETIHLSSLEFASAEKTIADGIIKKISAFTVAELGELLPQAYLRMIHKSPVGDCWTLPIHADNHPACRGTDHVETEAEARAKMVIYFLSKTNGLSAGNPASLQKSC